MKASRRTTVVASILLVVTLAASILLLRRVDQMRSGATLEEVLYLSSPKVLKRLSLGYDGLLADVYWTRVVQYYGRGLEQDDSTFQLLAPLLNITTALDPHLTVAYQFGANFLSAKPPLGAGQPEKATELADYGIRNNPEDWRLYYELGFIYYREKDYAHAADAFMRGSRIPNSHHWLKLMAAMMAGRAGDVQTARMMWTTTYQSTEDKSIRANAAAHLRALQVDEDVRGLEKLVTQYHEQNGHLPSAMSDLHLGGVPVDPLGNPYKLRPSGKIEVQNAEYLPFIEEGIPDGYVSPKKPKFLPTD